LSLEEEVYPFPGVHDEAVNTRRDRDCTPISGISIEEFESKG
jgi:hypothetical protein